MSTAPVETEGGTLPSLPLPGATPREVRAALRSEFRDQFDRDYQDALVKAGKSLDLGVVHDAVEHWRIRSWITRDPREHRRVVRRAAELLSGERPPVHEATADTESRI